MSDLLSNARRFVLWYALGHRRCTRAHVPGRCTRAHVLCRRCTRGTCTRDIDWLSNARRFALWRGLEVGARAHELVTPPCKPCRLPLLPEEDFAAERLHIGSPRPALVP